MPLGKQIGETSLSQDHRFLPGERGKGEQCKNWKRRENEVESFPWVLHYHVPAFSPDLSVLFWIVYSNLFTRERSVKLLWKPISSFLIK